MVKLFSVLQSCFGDIFSIMHPVQLHNAIQEVLEVILPLLSCIRLETTTEKTWDIFQKLF